MIKYSIIIPTLNKCDELLKPCLESIIKYTDLSETEIIIVANGCTDNTEQYVRYLQDILISFLETDSFGWIKFQPIKLISHPIPLGYSKAINKGLEIASGEYVILLNNDIILLPQNKHEWINLLLQPFFRSDIKVGITGPMKEFSPSANHDFIIFFCVMISREVLNQLPFLDTSFTEGYGEDTDYCIKAEQLGFHVLQVPEEKREYYEDKRMTGSFPIFHKGNQTFKDYPDESLIHKNNAILLQRYGLKSLEVGIFIEKAKSCDGFMSEVELTWLAKTVKKLPTNSYILECGSWHGRSSRALGDNLSEKSILYCIDTWQGSKVEQDTNHASAKWKDGDHAFLEFYENLYDLIKDNKVLPVRLNSKNATELYKKLGVKFQFIFLDAGHTKEEVTEDIENFLPLIADNGILCGHDYNYPDGIWSGVKEAVDEKFGTDNIEQPEGTNIWIVKDIDKIKNNNPYISKVYDCFPFNNELDLLERRFMELYDHVDRFVIVEASKTHSYKDKPFHFKDNLSRFAKYLNKVSHIMIDDYPAIDSWSIERHQRECIMRALTECNDNDIIIISDIDEIPSSSVIDDFIYSGADICSLEMDLYYYNENTIAKDKWFEGKILRYYRLKELGPCGARYFQNATRITNAGKHLSYFGGVDSIIEKIGNTAHQEYNLPQFKERQHIEQCIKEGKDLFDRDYIKYKQLQNAD